MHFVNSPHRPRRLPVKRRASASKGASLGGASEGRSPARSGRGAPPGQEESSSEEPEEAIGGLEMRTRTRADGDVELVAQEEDSEQFEHFVRVADRAGPSFALLHPAALLLHGRDLGLG